MRASWWGAHWINSQPRQTGSHCIPVRASSSTSWSGVPSLIAVAQPEFHVGSDKEFLLCNFHRHGCLVRQSFNIKGKRRQLFFCLYCGVINKNSDTALSHVMKHLNLQFVCGGCFSRSFLNGPALNKHMRTCASVTAIQTVGFLQWTPSLITRLHKAEPLDLWGPSHEAPLFDHTDHTRLSSVEPGHTCPPGCGPYAGGRVSSSYLHLLTYTQISFMVLIVLKSK